MFANRSEISLICGIGEEGSLGEGEKRRVVG